MTFEERTVTHPFQPRKKRTGGIRQGNFLPWFGLFMGSGAWDGIKKPISALVSTTFAMVFETVERLGDENRLVGKLQQE